MLVSASVTYYLVCPGGASPLGYGWPGRLRPSETPVLPRHGRHPHVLLHRQPRLTREHTWEVDARGQTLLSKRTHYTRRKQKGENLLAISPPIGAQTAHSIISTRYFRTCGTTPTPSASWARWSRSQWSRRRAALWRRRSTLSPTWSARPRAKREWGRCLKLPQGPPYR